MGNFMTHDVAAHGILLGNIPGELIFLSLYLPTWKCFLGAFDREIYGLAFISVLDSVKNCLQRKKYSFPGERHKVENMGRGKKLTCLHRTSFDQGKVVSYKKSLFNGITGRKKKKEK